jgi:large repetitive protein
MKAPAPVCGHVSAESGDGRATVSWTSPPAATLSAIGGLRITGYVVTPYLHWTALPAQRFSATSTHRVVSGLVNGSTYRFKVAVVTASGTGPASAATAPITIGAPTVPKAVTAAAVNGHVILRWQAPATTNGAPITAYIVTPYRNGVAQRPHVFGGRATTGTVTGLTNGAIYKFQIAAKNARGIGPQSARVAPTA